MAGEVNLQNGFQVRPADPFGRRGLYQALISSRPFFAASTIFACTFDGTSS